MQRMRQWRRIDASWRQRKKTLYHDNRDLAGGAFVVVGDVSGVAQAFGQEDDMAHAYTFDGAGPWFLPGARDYFCPGGLN